MSMLDSFLSEVVKSLRTKDGRRIAELIHLDFEGLSPDRRKPYADLNTQLNSQYPRGNDSDLVRRCKTSIGQDEFGSFSSSFSDSLIYYFRYLRDFTTADNLAKALEIRRLTSQCVTALGDTKYGVVMIPIVLSFSRTLAVVATNLDRTRSGVSQSNLPNVQSDESTPTKVTFVEDAANVLRDAFIKCLAGSPGVQRTTRPTSDDKRIGIYLTANSTLKLLFQCRKIRNAQQLFNSIDAQSPPLSYYPAAQRVTYLYYLGRYHFANNHFHRASLALQSAYDQCHAQALTHRRLILLYLTASNMCLGRFPSSKLLLRQECIELSKRFLPLCKIIKCGDLGRFNEYLDLKNESARWFLRKRMLLQLQNRCEVLVWWSLIRKSFIIAGYKGEEKKIPFLRLSIVRHAARWALSRTRKIQPAIPSFGNGTGLRFSNPVTSNNRQDEEEYIDPDLADIDAAVNETGFDVESGSYNDDMIGQHHHHQLSSSNNSNDDEKSPTIYEIESIFLSLIQQGFLRGFVSHANPRFAIPGSKAAGGPVNAGFPGIWTVVNNRVQQVDGEGIVPGWVREESLSGGGLRTGGAGGSMAGRVVRLSGARAVGVGS